MQRKWLPLLITNYLGVFNDNFLKIIICLVSVLWLSDQKNSGLLISGASGLFVLPYLLLSPLAGRYAKLYAKVRILRLAKLAEIPIMLIASIGFLTESLFLVLLSLTFMGIQSALYSPSKYSLIRDTGGEKEVPFGTGSMEMTTFFGVLTGTIAASLLSEKNNAWVFLLVFMGFAFSGYLGSRYIKAGEPKPKKHDETTVNPLLYLIRAFKEARQIKGLNTVIFSLGFFWLIALMLQMNILEHCPVHFGMNPTETGLVMAMAAVGIAIGSYLAGVISGEQINMKLSEIGLMGVIVSITTLLFISLSPLGFTILIFFTAFFSGLFKIPLNAWIQVQVKGRELGGMIAYQNMVEFLFLLVASVLFGILIHFFDTTVIFGAVCVIALAAFFLLKKKKAGHGKKQFCN